MTSEVTQALLPCPFCGGKAERFTLPEDEFGNGGGDVITCSRCQASSHVEFGRKENLVDRWNTRLTAQSGEGRSGAGEDDIRVPREPTDDMVQAGLYQVGVGGDEWAMVYQIWVDMFDRLTLDGGCTQSLPAALNARQSGEGEREDSLVIVECSDPNEGWSLSVKFGSGDHARDKMRAFSDRLRAGEV